MSLDDLALEILDEGLYSVVGILAVVDSSVNGLLELSPSCL